MAVTRSTAAERAVHPVSRTLAVRNTRGGEFWWLLGATLLASAGIWLAYEAKTKQLPAAAPLDLSQVSRREQLLPYLGVFPSPADRQFAARKIYDYLADHGNSLPNVGSLAQIVTTPAELARTPKLEQFRERLAQARSRSAAEHEVQHLRLLTPAQLAALKPSFAVRSAGGFRRQFLLWWGLWIAAFYAVHVFWRARGFTGHTAVLPALHLLTGIGFALMLGLRDPLRDMLSFAAFSRGVIASCGLLAVLSLIDYERRFRQLTFLPLLLSLGLSVLLILFGSGPGVSDAKVNLLGAQPVEAIKILLVFFLAGYFAKRWEFLRELKEKRPGLAHVTRWIEVPRLEYVMPVLVGMVVALLFFYLQKDLGPALLIAGTFLILYAVARRRILLSTVGFVLLLSGFLVGYALGHPHTVADRVQMWLSPWDNSVRGGDQIAHSLWALSSGGLWGTGPGLGDPEVVPAGYTDLILAVLGEEWGFVGILAVYLLYGLLTFVSIRIALQAATDFGFFLALGLTLLIVLQVVLISAGILDLAPLSGVVTPFLSYGRTSMLANFAIFAILLSLSRRPGAPGQTAPFREPVRWLSIALGGAGLLLVGRAAYLQTVRADATAGAGTLVVQADGARRYQYNPRLLSIVRSIPRGAIFDRNGLPLATSNWDDLVRHQEEYRRLGVNLENCCSRQDTRHYPLGSTTFHLLGDLRTHLNWSAANSSLIERDNAVTLQGFDDRARVIAVKDLRTGAPSYTVRYDYRELIPLLRHRYEPNHPSVRRILERNRDVHASIDARFQLRAAQILEQGLRRTGQSQGAVVVLDSASGDLLAAANYPLPPLATPVTAEPNPQGPLLDRVRYGLYPPGSTFKIVTAIAALRQNPDLANATYQCVQLPDGRAGNFIQGSRRPIRDDVQDRTPHGAVNMEKGTIVSCNAYFAQLGAYRVGATALLETAKLLGISVAKPETAAKLKEALPQASYGQGQVVASPFQMARVAATVANHGRMPYGRWVIDENNPRLQAPQAIFAPTQADQLGRYMREVVTSGTGRRAAGAPVPLAGKTGTAELANAPSHAWFIGYAPYGGPGRRLAFAVLVENGQYGGTAAAPIAAELVTAAHQLGLLQEGTPP